MESQGDGSVTRWIGDLKCGGDSAVLHLWERLTGAKAENIWTAD